MLPDDTIVAISSAVGLAARMIVRISGAKARPIAEQLCPELASTQQSALRCRLHLSGFSLPVWCYRFFAPRTYTGEDLAEFHLPGNPRLARILVDELTRRGARHAEPGEFTARAYFNGQMDLSEAEGVAAMVAAQNEQGLRAARQLISGELARRLRPAMDQLAETLGLVEVGIDFSEEDVTFLSSAQVIERVNQVDGMLEQLLVESPRFEEVSHQPTAVLVGRPNAGKSTLLNVLAGHERAVVSPQAGTTRDALSVEVVLKRGVIRLLDVAGLEESTTAPSNPLEQVEQHMQSQARRAVETSDLLILVKEAGDAREEIQLHGRPHLVVVTKVDLHPSTKIPPGATGISAATLYNIPELRDQLDSLAFNHIAGQATLALNARHREAILSARSALSRARERAGSGAAELIALELRDALDALGAVLGVVSPDEVLGRIFATFCIGK